jgi:hypothetical protein
MAYSELNNCLQNIFDKVKHDFSKCLLDVQYDNLFCHWSAERIPQKVPVPYATKQRLFHISGRLAFFLEFFLIR